MVRIVILYENEWIGLRSSDNGLFLYLKTRLHNDYKHIKMFSLDKNMVSEWGGYVSPLCPTVDLDEYGNCVLILNGSNDDNTNPEFSDYDFMSYH